MTLFQALHTLILGPIELLFDFIYATAYQMLGNAGLSIVFLSIAVNILVLPLYKRADAIQEEERRKTLLLQPDIDHIRKVFQGDERFMILQTYYRQNKYKPYYVLKGSVSLLLEIPFFIAAYQFLSGLVLLEGRAFGPIVNLGAPDGLLHVAGLSVNFLPILMTGINLVSSAFYTRGLPRKDKIQLLVTALVFLILLYDSPAGLVFYWTLNNLFSLGKNVLARTHCRERILCWLCSVAGILLLLFSILTGSADSIRGEILVCCLSILAQLPLLWYYRKKKKPFEKKKKEETKSHRIVFFAACISITILTGLVIPGAVVSASTAEFVNLSAYRSPLWYMVHAFLLAAGTFFVWCVVYYALSSSMIRRKMSLVMVTIMTISAADFLFFGKDYGNMSSVMRYDTLISIDGHEILRNIVVVIFLAGLVFILWKKKISLLQVFCISGCMAFTVLSGSHILSIQRQEADLKVQASQPVERGLNIPLDKTGKNVVVLMMDRAISCYVPYILQEKSEIQEQFAGFTYYPNTLSYGAYTNVGAPPVFGGYDYTPENMNAREDVKLVDKHNEALKIMPLNFLEQGYEVTVSDATYANYAYTADMSIYDEWPEIHQYNAIGSYTVLDDGQRERKDHLRNRNLFCYSLFRSAPSILQARLYNNGIYNESNALKDARNSWTTAFETQYQEGVTEAQGIEQEFMDSYGVLQNLSGATQVRDSGEGTFFMMSNEATHEPMLLQEPEYEPHFVIDNTLYETADLSRKSVTGEKIVLDDEAKMIHYHANMAMMIQLGRWFDELRRLGVYDNTRIIIVSDHGRNLGLFNLQLSGSQSKFDYEDILYYNALLMVKDFNSRAYKTDNRFMTNADTPLLAFEGVVDHPWNPFLQKSVSNAEKEQEEKHILYTSFYRNSESTTFQKNEESPHVWLTMRGEDLFNLVNWSVDR